MLKNNLKDISNIVLLRSDKILYELINNSSYNLDNKSKSYLYGMQDFYPNSFRKGTIENSMNYTMDKNYDNFTLDYSFSFLDKLFDEYIKINGSHIYAKKETLNKYSSLISKVHPFNIIGYKLAIQYNKKEITLNNIKEYTKYITPLALSTNRDFKDYADNHIHLGGTNDTALNFLALLSQPTKKEFYTNEVFDSLPRINEFSYINNGNISFGHLIDIAKYCVSTINYYCLYKNNNNANINSDLNKLLNYGTFSMIDIDFASFDMLNSFQNNSMPINEPILNEVIINKKNGYVSKQWFLYNILVFSIHSNNSTSKDLQRIIKIFIHITNILRSYMVMSQNIGLSNFMNFFDSKFRKQDDNRQNNIASNIIANGTTKVEAKISSGAIFDKNPEFIKYKLAFDKEIIKKESDNISNEYQKYFLDTNKSERNYHFCIHFIRLRDKDKQNDSGYLQPRFYSRRLEYKKEAKALNDFLYNQSQVISKFDFYRKYHPKKMEVLKNKEVLENQYIDLTKLITSIDVAGDESVTPPEVFAPVIKFLRRDTKKQDEFISNYIKYKKDGHNFLEHHKLRLSVHAGEDFNHIVTGMRTIHETVKFYHMEENDRLGHALAIGLNPKKWCALNGDIFVTKQEHLDNLIWLYHQSIEVMDYYTNTHKLQYKYKKYIKQLSKEVYEDNYSIDDLYKAWKLREYCPIEKQNNNFDKVDEYILAVSFKHREDYIQAIEIDNKYHTNSNVRKNGNVVLKIEYTSIENNNYDYIITDEDLELIEAVQDRLIQKFYDKGIIIETNPSSNVYIAHINEYEQHPIYRWNPIEDSDLFKNQNHDTPKFNKYGLRSSRMKVCVNTDDPAIMPTTLRNEFNLLKYTALNKHSKNKEKIDNWSENIRKLGIEIFDYDHNISEFLKV